MSESYAFDVDTAHKRVRQAVDEEIYGLPADYHSGYVEHVLSVTTERANAALKKRIFARDFVVTVVGTASELEGAIEKSIAKLDAHEVVPFDKE